MKKRTAFLLGLLSAAAAGGTAAYLRNKRLISKYNFASEYKRTLGITLSPKNINPSFIKFMNKMGKGKIKEIEDVMTSSTFIPSYDGAKILVNVIEPLECKKEEILPCLVYYHGGGYVIDSIPQYFSFMAQYAKLAHCKVVYVHYRTAYEKTADTCFEDAYAGLLWAYENAENLRIDKERIAVGGDSAGGGISAAITHISRDRKGPKIAFQMLIYPVIDATLSTSSMQKFTDTPGWNAKANKKMWKEVKKSLSPDMLKYASPILNPDFSGLCNAYVEVEEYDCLHDEGLNYAEKLRENGYEVQINDMKGTYHGFEQSGEKMLGRQIFETRAAALCRAFQKENA